ncbi:unnamed protein product [Meganyctiphanes norvegica]|uniref:Uncharacterized protein n=1 Tax=Meganyctiphanes norvegica TaxID=48144 RepID=A0AAV2SXS7_MEGNR
MDLAASAARDVRPFLNALKQKEFVRLIQTGVHMEHMHQLAAVEDVIVVSQSGHQSQEGHVIVLTERTAQRQTSVHQDTTPASESVMLHITTQDTTG